MELGWVIAGFMIEIYLSTPGYRDSFSGLLQGTEMREGNSPSLFNPVEAVQVMLYCCQLTKKLYNPVAVSDIGIIAPYRKQVRQCCLLFKAKCFKTLA